MKKKIIWTMACLFAFCILFSGCGDSGKNAPAKAPEQPKAVAPQAAPAGTAVSAVTQAAPAGTRGASLSCYEVGLRTGRCAAQTMSGSPCNPADEIPVPPECKGTADMEKGLKDGRKSVF